jgi:hypothetical protein
MLIAAGLATGAIILEDFDEAAMTLAEVPTHVEGRPEVMHVPAVQVDGAAVLGRGRLGGVDTLALGRGGSPVGCGYLLLLLGVRVLLSAVGDEILVSNCRLL